MGRVKRNMLLYGSYQFVYIGQPSKQGTLKNPHTFRKDQGT